ncbi:MAG: class I SAM-dependent methyltransferase [Hyphomicrobiales bacterium]|nr:class I SAM-dependent methyltransferase [Hyphomicrobiales bacterium]
MSQRQDPEDWDALIAAADGDPHELARLAARMVDGELPKAPVDTATATARSLCYRAIAAAPDDPEISAIAASLLSETVPQWHATIILDRARNEAYDAALQAAIKPGMRVLEVGAGTGLLAMMAARAGAAEVITCEANPLIAERARVIIAANGYADRVRIIAKHSSELRIGEDLAGPADVFVSEIISDALIGEGMLLVAEDVVPRLLKPGAAVIPYRGSVRVALANYTAAGTMRMGEVDGFDVSAFNRLIAPSYALPIEDPLLSLSSAAADLFAFTFADGGPFPARRTRSWESCAPRRRPMAWCNGCAFAPTPIAITRTCRAPAKARAGMPNSIRSPTTVWRSRATISLCMAATGGRPCGFGPAKPDFSARIAEVGNFRAFALAGAIQPLQLIGNRREPRSAGAIRTKAG